MCKMKELISKSSEVTRVIPTNEILHSELHHINALSNHGCTLVQAVVMVTAVLIGNRHFWTAGNKKNRHQSSPNFAQAITSV